MVQRHRAGEAAGEVVRAPVADADRRIHHDRVRREAIHQRGGVDIGLERGAGLAQCIGRAVELAFPIIAPAHHGAHGAVGIHQHSRRLFGVVVVAVLPK
jgi:hypothetical protein